MASVPRASQIPSAVTVARRIVTPIAVATERRVTPAQPTTASSSMSAEHASLPEPPPALCRPATTLPAQPSTDTAMSLNGQKPSP